jgi:meso-butanediol dehydrogenase / (S,S)-butanediol dehydrogenase / diacetyl reductase
MSRAVIVTGAGTGIGAAAARRLARDGASVVLVGRRRDPIERVAAATGQTFVVADASTEEGVERIVAATVDAHGGVDGLVLNAGVMLPGTVAEASVDDWRATLDVSLTGPFLLARAALPQLLERQGSVVSVASIAALRAGPGMAAYCASKAGLVLLTQCLAVEHGAAGLRANVVAPGWVRTEMADEEMDEFGGPRGLDREAAYAEVTRNVPARRPATADEAAAAVVWLLSPQAAYVNGSVLTVDGGTSIVDVGTLAFGD